MDFSRQRRRKAGRTERRVGVIAGCSRRICCDEQLRHPSMFLVLHTPVSTVSLVDLQFDVFVLHCPIMFREKKKWYRANSDSSGLVEAGAVGRRRRRRRER